MSLSFQELAASCVGLDREVPVLGGGRRRYVNFDNAATTPALRQVRDAVDAFLEMYSSVHRGTGYKSLVSTEAFERCRKKVLDFVGAGGNAATAIFGKNTTEMVNKLSRRFGLRPDDVVLISDAEHHSNDLPWRKVARVVRIPVDRRGAMDMDQIETELKRAHGRARVVAICGASNVTGYQAPLHAIAALAHRHGAQVFADLAQLAPHRAVDVGGEDTPEHLDFVAFSAHKMYAPYGVGVLVGPKRFFDQGDPDYVGGGMVELVTADRAFWSPSPDRDEPGTPNLLGAVALARAIGCLAEVGFDAIASHERRLTAYALRRLQEVPGLTLYGDVEPVPGEDRIGVIPFNLAGLSHSLLAAALSWEGAIGVRHGCFCAHPFIAHLLEVSPGEAERTIDRILAADRSGVAGLVRMSFGIFNTEAEVDHAVGVLREIATRGPRGRYRMVPAWGEYEAEGCPIEIDPAVGL